MRPPCRLEQTFDELRRRGAGALVPYFVADFPSRGVFRDCLVGAEGADAIEVGVPFSDPIADGPAIRAAARHALEGGATLPRVLDSLDALRGRLPAPPLLMTYLNPVLSYGIPRFFRDAAEAGAAGAILPDLDLGGAAELARAARSRGVDLVFLAAPTSPPSRLRALAAATEGFLYLVSRTGTTGLRKGIPPGLSPYVARARAAARAAGRPSLPLLVGFGVSDPRSAASIAALSDGIVVGSALVRALARGGRPRALGLLRSFRRSIDLRRPGRRVS